MKPCKSDEIRNPKTNRCVKKNGTIGKELVKHVPSKKKSTPVTIVKQQSSHKKCSFNRLIEKILPEASPLSVKIFNKIFIKSIKDLYYTISFLDKKNSHSENIKTAMLIMKLADHKLIEKIQKSVLKYGSKKIQHYSQKINVNILSIVKECIQSKCNIKNVHEEELCYISLFVSHALLELQNNNRLEIFETFIPKLQNNLPDNITNLTIYSLFFKYLC